MTKRELLRVKGKGVGSSVVILCLGLFTPLRLPQITLPAPFGHLRRINPAYNQINNDQNSLPQSEPLSNEESLAPVGARGRHNPGIVSMVSSTLSVDANRIY
jgi:hypothetical protein